MKNQSPRLVWFVLTIQKGGKTETRRILAISRDNAIEKGNRTLKALPGSGSAKVISAREE